MLITLPVRGFLYELSQGSATPGGGSAAGLSGAQSAALLAMVCNLTIGHKKYADVEGEMQEALEKALRLRDRLMDLIEEDAHAFDSVMDAYRLPKDTPEQKAARSAAIQAGLKEAARTPMETLRHCVAVLELAPEVVSKGNPNVISDGGAGVLSAHAGMMIAALNVQINLNAIKDEAFVTEQTEEMKELIARGDAAKDKAWAIVAARLGM
ncbi:MAG TPA: methenyltetrahydrofolate cyclohydrolase [Caldilineales bacterium]|nr:methenyltetrahydrofolate cyclohydrolase [Caldilineales bacterium]